MGATQRKTAMKRFFEFGASIARASRGNFPISGIARLHPVANFLAFAIVGAGIVAIPFFTSAWDWVPQTSEARTLLATLLTAQAAIAALTLAVTQFVMQGVRARRDANDQMYNEYIRQSWVKPIFWGSIVAVAVSGLVFVVLEFARDIESTCIMVPGLENLILVSVIAFFASLIFPVLLFRKAISLLLPNRWSAIRRVVNERGVLQAVEAFLRRRGRATSSLQATEPRASFTFPDPDEGLADEAIRGLLGDARRAMSEHGLREFTRSLGSIKDLISYAMDEIERNGDGWSLPGKQAEWPPMREFFRNMYSFREDVISGGKREYVFELLGLDYWLLSTGARRGCGELFTAGLESYRNNCQIANRLADAETKGILLERVWLNSPWTIARGEPREAFPYAVELLRHQEQMLSDALNLDQPEDYEAIHKGFKTFLRLSRWDLGRRYGDSFSNAFEQLHRVVLMGVAGRAIILAEECRIGDPTRYLAVPREIFRGVVPLADDIAQALQLEDRSQASQWSEWEWEGAEPGVVQMLSPERYPLTFFAIRLMELSSDTMPALDLHGTANQVLNWFESNADRLLPFVADQPGTSRQQLREWAAGALKAAVRTDETAEENRIIISKLSLERIAKFKSDVYAAAFELDSIEGLFRRYDAFLYLAEDADAVPKERGFYELVPKAPFVDTPIDGYVSDDSLQGDQWGRDLAKDILRLLCEALDEASTVTVPLKTPEELFSAFDRAKAALNPMGELVAVLAGDWIDVAVALDTGEHDNFVPAWQIPEADQLVEFGEYHGHILLRGPRDGERRMYLLEPESWGCFVRAQCEGGQDLRIDFKPVSPERARELLEAKPDYFPSEPEHESKLRKLQTQVELRIYHRVEFRVNGSSHARRITSTGSNVDAIT